MRFSSRARSSRNWSASVRNWRTSAGRASSGCSSIQYSAKFCASFSAASRFHAAKRLPSRHHALGEHVAEHLGQVFGDVPAQVAEQVLHRPGQVGVALDADFAHQRVFAAQRRRQCACADGDDQAGHGILGCAAHQPGVEDVQAQRWQRRGAEFHALPGVGLELVARPGLRVEQVVESENSRVRQQGLLGCEAWLLYLLDAREHPAGRAGHRLRQIPDFLERFGLGIGRPRVSCRRSARSPSGCRLR